MTPRRTAAIIFAAACALIALVVGVTSPADAVSASGLSLFVAACAGALTGFWLGAEMTRTTASVAALFGAFAALISILPYAIFLVGYVTATMGMNDFTILSVFMIILGGWEAAGLPMVVIGALAGLLVWSICPRSRDDTPVDDYEPTE